MDYLTITEAAALWEIPVSHVLDLCNNSRIPGVICSGTTWQIPKGTTKPVAKAVNKISSPDIEGAIQALSGDDDMLARIIEFFQSVIFVYHFDASEIRKLFPTIAVTEKMQLSFRNH